MVDVAGAALHLNLCPRALRDLAVELAKGTLLDVMRAVEAAAQAADCQHTQAHRQQMAVKLARFRPGGTGSAARSARRTQSRPRLSGGEAGSHWRRVFERRPLDSAAVQRPVGRHGARGRREVGRTCGPIGAEFRARSEDRLPAMRSGEHDFIVSLPLCLPRAPAGGAGALARSSSAT